MNKEKNNFKYIQITLERQLAEDTKKALEEIGLTQSKAIEYFYKYISKNGVLPFETKPNKRDLASQELLKTSKKLPQHIINNANQIKSEE